MTEQRSFLDSIFEEAQERPCSHNDLPRVLKTYRDGTKKLAGEIADDAFRAMVAQDDEFYHTRGTIGRIIQDEYGTHHIKLMDKDSVHGYLTRSMNFVELSRPNDEGEQRAKIVDPLQAYAADILSRDANIATLPKLKGIFNHPILTKDGVDFSVGYNSNSCVYIPPTAHVELIDMDVSQAIKTIEDVVMDFNFRDDDNMWTALTLPLTMICRNFIEGPVPIYVMCGDSGAGKTLLVQALNAIITGLNVRERQSPTNQTEWKKSVFTSLINSDEIVLYDNSNAKTSDGGDYTLEAGALASAVTSNEFTDRILGRSEEQTIAVNTTFVLTGIGMDTQLSEELFKRCVFVQLMPNEHTEFTHTPLVNYVKEQRTELLSAYVCLVNNWVDAGMPQGVSALNRFEMWSSIISGILDHAGIELPEFFNKKTNSKWDSKSFKGEDEIRNYLSDCYRADQNGVVFSDDLMSTIGVLSSQKGFKTPTPKQYSNIIQEVFPNVENTRAYDDNKSRKRCWKGISPIE